MIATTLSSIASRAQGWPWPVTIPRVYRRFCADAIRPCRLAPNQLVFCAIR
jgi:hypothetical protein